MRTVGQLLLGMTFSVTAIVGMSSDASAQNLEAALELESEGQLEEALRAFEEVLEAPGNSRRDLTTIYQHLGMLRFAAGDEEGVSEAMMWLLAVAPRGTLPDSAPPEVEEIFQSAQRRWGDRRLHAEIAGEPEELRGGDLSIQIRAVDDVARMVGAVQVLDDGALLADEPGDSPWTVILPDHVIPDDGRAQLTIRLLDEAGGELWQDEVEVSSDGGRDGGGQRGLGMPPRTQRILAWSLIGAGGALVIGGAIAAGVDGSATGNYRIVEGMLEQEVRDTATGGWILISTGLASAVAGVLLLLLAPRGESGDDDEAQNLRLAGRDWAPEVLALRLDHHFEAIIPTF